jgi:hypothetical protein
VQARADVALGGSSNSVFVIVAVVCGVAMVVVHKIDVVAVRNGDMPTPLAVDVVMAVVGDVCWGSHSS